MVVGGELHALELEGAVLAHVFLIHMNGHDFRQEHIVGSQLRDFFHHAFQAHRGFCYHRNAHDRSFFPVQIHLFPLIQVFAGTDAAEIRRLHQILVHQVDNEFFFCLYQMMGKTGFSHGHIGHRRLAVHDTGPADGDDIVFFPVAAAHHHGRNRIEHGSGFRCDFAHDLLLSIRSNMSLK